MQDIEVILNTSGGGFVEGKMDADVLREFAEQDARVNLFLAKSGDEIATFAKKAVNKTGSIIVAGGGDGTINAVATEVIAAKKTLGVLPLGTLNHFSKDLAIPQDLAGAAAVILLGNVIKVDTGEVNGRLFLNNSSIGLYPRIVHKRDQMQDRLGRGKWSAAVLAAIKVFRRDPFLTVRIEVDGREIVRKTPFVFVGNNEYGMDIYNIGRRASLTNGKLSLYLLRHSGRWGVVMMLFRTLFGVVRQSRDFETITAEAITIDVRKKSVMVAIDGEVTVMETPLIYRIRPRSLAVLAPASQT